jgi:hypothetical protein
VGWERRRRRNRERECWQMGAYNGFSRRNHQRIYSVGDSVGDSATSLYGYLSLNPSVKSPDVTTPFYISRRTVYSVGDIVGIYRRKYSVGIYRQILRRNYCRRYILPTEQFRR